MIDVVIKDSGEPNVTKLTYENLWKELKDIPGAELQVGQWFKPMASKNRYVCYVEADCLVNSAYFSTLMGLFKKNPMHRKLSMMTSGTGVNNWANKFYGYCLGDNYSDGVIPVKQKKSNKPYPVQIGYLPGAIIRRSMLERALKDMNYNNSWENDLVYLSAQFSLAFWKQGDGNPVHIYPETTYVTTEDYVNDIGKFEHPGADLKLKFVNESI